MELDECAQALPFTPSSARGSASGTVMPGHRSLEQNAAAWPIERFSSQSKGERSSGGNAPAKAIIPKK